jgi:hypothetical protein
VLAGLLLTISPEQKCAPVSSWLLQRTTTRSSRRSRVRGPDRFCIVPAEQQSASEPGSWLIRNVTSGASYAVRDYRAVGIAGVAA